VVLAATLAASLVHATPSHAVGGYIHQSCVTGSDLGDAYGGWQPHAYTMNGNANGIQCPWGGLRSEMIPTGTIPLGATVGWTYSASDDGGGVARLRLFVDGQATAVDHVIDTNNGHCQVASTEGTTWVFSWPKPCPGSVNADEAIDTTTIADGVHTITAKVVDA